MADLVAYIPILTTLLCFPFAMLVLRRYLEKLRAGEERRTHLEGTVGRRAHGPESRTPVGSLTWVFHRGHGTTSPLFRYRHIRRTRFSVGTVAGQRRFP